jgi:hypothetical protein
MTAAVAGAVTTAVAAAMAGGMMSGAAGAATMAMSMIGVAAVATAMAMVMAMPLAVAMSAAAEVAAVMVPAAFATDVNGFAVARQSRHRHSRVIVVRVVHLGVNDLLGHHRLAHHVGVEVRGSVKDHITA